MLNIKDNFSEILLISEQPVIFYLDEPHLLKLTDISMSLPKLKDTLNNPYIQQALAIFNLSVGEIAKAWNLQLERKWQLIELCQTQLSKSIGRKLVYLFEYLFGDQFRVQKNEWYIGDLPLEENLYLRIEEIVLIAAGIRGFDEQPTKMDKPQWLIDKENEIRRIKAQRVGAYNSMEKLSKTIMPINYEFGYTLEQIFDMNYYHVKYLAGFVSRAVRYSIQKHQIFGKGKIKYITEK